MPTTTELTERYIEEHISIKDCLKKGIVNYSALSRLAAKDLGIEKTSSKEAILVAARRYRERLKGRAAEDNVRRLFKNSSMEIKNKITSYTLDKSIYPESLVEIERAIKKSKSLFFAIEGARTITVILQQQDEEQIEKRFKSQVISKKKGLSLFTITSKGIESTPGAVAYISGLFFENEVNIEEFMSCYDDTLILIKAESLEKAIKFLNF